MRQWEEERPDSEEIPSTISQSSGYKMEGCEKELRSKGGKGDVFLESFFYILTGSIDNLKNVVSANLKVLMVFGQPVASLEGLDYLKNLTELWVCECHLENACVNNCTQLEKLYLYSNRIKSFPKMNHLNKLSVLSLASNNISTLTPFLPPSLTEFNLADNAVTNLGYLSGCKSLEIGNFSGNNLKTFDSLYPLTTLPKLRSLHFVDGIYKPSPVSSLVNYRSFIIYNIQHLQYLDGVLVEAEERENGIKFYSKKHRYYRVLHNSFANCFFKEHQKRLSSLNLELNNLKNAIMSAAVTMDKLNDTSNTWKECKKKLQNFEISQFQLECKQFHWLPKLRKESKIKTVLLDIEIKHYGNIMFFYFTKESGGLVMNNISDMMDNFICPYLKRNTNVRSVDVEQVVQIVNVQQHTFERFKGVKEVMGIGVMESQFFIINQPSTVDDSAHWPFAFIKEYAAATGIKCTVTNSLAIADSKGIDKVSAGNSNMFKIDELSGKRVLILGYVISDELMGSFTRQETAMRHLKANNEPPEHCYHCAMYSSVIPENVLPVFIIEYSFILKDQDLRGPGKDFFVPEVTTALPKAFSAHSKFNAVSWQGLTSLTLSKAMLSNFGLQTPIEGVTTLDVSYNQLNTLFEIGRIFPRLTKLKADFNDVASTSFGREMPDMKEVSLKYNKISKYLMALHWLKKYATSLEKIELAFNPFKDIHDQTHVKHLAVEYFPSLRKLDDEWLVETLRDKKVYKFCPKDFPNVRVSYAELEALTSKPKVVSSAALCLDKNGTPTSHCTYNKFNDLLCLYVDSYRTFQAVEIGTKMSCLKWVTIKNNQLMSMAFLNDCHGVEELDLSNNILLSGALNFANLQNLMKLDLSWNYLKEVDGLLKIELPNLLCINLSYNSIKSFDGLRNLKTLEEIYAAGNEMRKWDHLQFVKDFQSLKVIDLSDNQVEDDKLLRQFLIYNGKGLQYVNGTVVEEEEIVDANDSLSGTLNKSYLTKIYKPNQIRLLSDLAVKKCGIRKVHLKEPDLQQLTTVNLEGNCLTTIGSLCQLKQLKHLCVTNNKIVSFGELKGSFDALETLHLNCNNISDLVPLELERFPKLSAIYLQDNQLTSLEGIKDLKRLQYLVVDRNRLEHIKPDELPSDALKELYVEHNQLKDLTFLKSLKNLKKLFLGFNKIQDQSSIECLSSLKKLTELTVVGNPIERLNSHYFLILTLLPRLAILDGIDIERTVDS